jgi:medium-chain acyl-[acyl-carrier-protein] hydrolase
VNSFNVMSVAQGVWLGCPKPNPQASLRLFCFPYAGAGSSIFTTWSHALPPDIELNLIHLPGRDGRIREPLQVDLSALVESLGESFHSRLDKPFAFFGHSMGALISFEVARYLRRQYARQPKHLFISSRPAPQLTDPQADLYRLPGKDFLDTVEDLYGVLPDIVKEDAGVLELFLAIMRADLTLIGTHQYHPEPALDCPISVFGGEQDQSVTADSLYAWREQTLNSFSMTMFPGDHFFIHSSRQALLQNLSQNLT